MTKEQVEYARSAIHQYECIEKQTSIIQQSIDDLKKDSRWVQVQIGWQGGRGIIEKTIVLDDKAIFDFVSLLQKQLSRNADDMDKLALEEKA